LIGRQGRAAARPTYAAAPQRRPAWKWELVLEGL